jgi:hypothetical protein
MPQVIAEQLADLVGSGNGDVVDNPFGDAR